MAIIKPVTIPHAHVVRRTPPLTVVAGTLYMGGAGVVLPSRISPDPAYHGPHCGVDGCPTCGFLHRPPRLDGDAMAATHNRVALSGMPPIPGSFTERAWRP